MSDMYRRLTSLQNDQVKDLVRLRNRRDRDRQQVTLIEEPLVIARALAAGYPCSTVYFCPELIATTDAPLLTELKALAAGPSTVELVEVSAPVMNKISYREHPAGLLVVAPQRHLTLNDLDLKKNASPLLVVLEGLEKPGNLGAVMRIADGAGADAVIVCGQGTDLFNPNVLRASRGAFFALPTVACGQTELLAFLREKGISTAATSPAAPVAWDQTDLTGPVAILLGTEHDGLSADLLGSADLTLAIPMLGQGDSLNVATSAAILLYEAVRQRRSRG